MSIQTLKQAELDQVGGAFFSFPNFGSSNGGPTGSFTQITPFGVFDASGFANPTDGAARTVSFNGIFGNFGNTVGFGQTGPIFSNIFQPAF